MIAITLFTRAAVLLAATRTVSALGTAIVHNQCDFDVYLWSVSDTAGSMQTLSANGGEYSEAYQNNPDGGGISIKVGRDTTGFNITQYEYTLQSGSLWYDLSLINGYPFVEFGVSIIPSDTTCSSVICPAGLELCAAAYMVPDDNFATAECTSSADTVMLLCSGDENTSGGSSASAVASSAVSTASAVTVFTTTPTSVAASTTKSTTSHHTHTFVEEPAVSPSTTASPSVAVTTQANDNVIIHTTFVTYVVTVEARDAAPTAAPIAARQIHRHEHGQQKRHEHGHIHHEADA